MKIAYLINQYPKVSHSFIRREILALEHQGFDVQRIAVRGWDGELVDDEDLRERDRTHYVLQDGMASLLAAGMRMLAASPLRFFHALRLALKMGWRADRPWPFHLIYLAEACRIVPWLSQFGACHLHAHFGTNSAEVAMLATTLGGPPYSFTVHGPEEFDKPEFLGIKEKVSRAAFVVAISSFGRSQLFRWARYVDWPKVHVVHCGLEPVFHAVPAVPIPAAPRVVCVGRLCEQKGQLLLVNAVSQLLRKGIEIELVLAGDGEMRAELEALITQRRLQGRVRITGWISSDQVRAEILATRALVLPSFAEGLPVVIMEAMALRRPVLTTYVAGIPELVRPGENGWLFPAGDIDALAAALEEFLLTPVAILESMGEAGYQRVLERHSVDIEAAKLAQLFCSVQTSNPIMAPAPAPIPLV
ncbi:MAG: glycosyltransferase family 4 protein [Glaciimonas sp.]|nr:glycosyltransferase family 4 protein [Glaciimonas sp.]